MMNRFFDMLRDSVGDTANKSAPAVPAPPPLNTTAPFAHGVYLRPWTESTATLVTLRTLKPHIVRMVVPFDIYPGVGLHIHDAILAADDVGARPLLVTSLATTQGATAAQVVRDAPMLATFYGGIAKEYPGCAWELGNEAEISSPSNGPVDPTSYAQYSSLLATAIRAGDPSATIGTAGTSGFHNAWIRQVLAAGVKPDFVGVHPYGTAPTALASAVTTLGVSPPVWFTEYGIQNATGQQVHDYLAYSRGVVPVAVYFCLSDLSADNNEPFGLLDASAVARPGFAAFAAF